MTAKRRVRGHCVNDHLYSHVQNVHIFILKKKYVALAKHVVDN